MTDTVSARAHNPLAFLDAEIEDLRAKGLYRRLRVVQSEQRSRCVIDGREVITLSSNNYLGLNTHPHLREAAIEALGGVQGGNEAVIIGEIREEPSGAVLVGTRYGGTRIVDMLVGDPLPRIC